MQKINFTHFFLTILQRKSKFVILDNFGMLGHIHLKWQYTFEETFDVYLQVKNQLQPSCFPWDISKILQTYYTGHFGYAWLYTPKVILSTCGKPLCLSASKNSISSSMFFGRYCKNKQHSYFGYFRHAWLCTPKMISINLWKILMLIYMPKTNFIIHFFLGILHFKEFFNLIG